MGRRSALISMTMTIVYALLVVILTSLALIGENITLYKMALLVALLPLITMLTLELLAYLSVKVVSPREVSLEYEEELKKVMRFVEEVAGEGEGT